MGATSIDNLAQALPSTSYTPSTLSRHIEQAGKYLGKFVRNGVTYLLVSTTALAPTASAQTVSSPVSGSSREINSSAHPNSSITRSIEEYGRKEELLTEETKAVSYDSYGNDKKDKLIRLLIGAAALTGGAKIYHDYRRDFKTNRDDFKGFVGGALMVSGGMLIVIPLLRPE